MSRAKKGGEIGKNGEHYKGGQFLPSSEHTVKGAQSGDHKPPTGKRQIAPYVWEVPPSDGQYWLSIYQAIEHRSFISNRDDCEYIKGQGLVGAVLEYSGDSHYEMQEFDPGEIPPQYTKYKTLENGKCTAVDNRTGAFVKTTVVKDPDPFYSGLVDRWNNGERWFLLSEHPYHHLNKKKD